VDLYPDKFPTQESIAEELGYSEPRVANWIRTYEAFRVAATLDPFPLVLCSSLRL